MAVDTGSTSRQIPEVPEDRTNPTLGVTAAVIIVFIWSGWLIVSKVGAESALTIFDIAALRFGLSGLVSLPVVLYYKPWRGMPVHRMVVIAILAGVPYVLLGYAAFTFAPAAYGGVFMNGVLPAMTLTLGWFWLKERPRAAQVGGATLIIAGAILAALEAIQAASSGAWIGALLFLFAACWFSVYLILNRVWRVRPLQVLLVLSVLSGAIYVPSWFFFLPSNLAQAPTSQILLQGTYQMLPNLVGLNLLTLAVRHAGASASAGIMSAVPSVGAILGLVLLGEKLGPLTWAGIVVLSLGILLTALRPRASG